MTNGDNNVTYLYKNGTGNWILGNANTFTGTTYINAGTLELGNFNALQDSIVQLNTANGLTFESSGTYNIPA